MDEPAKLMDELEAMRNKKSGDDWGDVVKWGSDAQQLFENANPGDREIWATLTDQVAPLERQPSLRLLAAAKDRLSASPITADEPAHRGQ